MIKQNHSHVRTDGLIFMSLIIVFLLCLCEKDLNWAVTTDFFLIEKGNKCGGVNYKVKNEALTMSYEERTAYENEHIFEGYIWLDKGFIGFDLYHSGYLVKSNLCDSGNYYIKSNCHAIPAYCPKY